MKVKLDVTFSLCKKIYGDNGDDPNFITKKQMIEHYDEEIDRLKKHIRESETERNLKTLKSRIKNKKEAQQDVKSIEDWESFHEAVVKGNYHMTDKRSV